MRVFTLIFIFLSLNTRLFSQEQRFIHQKWEGGPLLSFAQYQGDMNNPNIKGFHSGYGFLLRRRLTDNFYARTTFHSSKISGDDSRNEKYAARGFSFSSPVRDINLLAEYDFGGRRRYKNHYFHKIVSPYVTLGMSLTHIKPSTNFNEANNKQMLNNIMIDKNMPIKNIVLGLSYGLGLKIDVNNGWAMNIDISKRLPFYDYIDGVKASAGTSKNDAFGFASLGLIYRFRAKNDKDRDGVSDFEDTCPRLFGNPSLSGCPDKDGDMVPDKDDLCPNLVGDRNFSGCPQAKPAYEVKMIKNNLKK